MISFGAYIKRARAAVGLSQRAVARAAGLAPDLVSKIEKTDYATKKKGLVVPVVPLTEPRLRGMANALQCNPDELICHAGRVPCDVVNGICTNPEVLPRVRGVILKKKREDGVD